MIINKQKKNYDIYEHSSFRKRLNNNLKLIEITKKKALSLNNKLNWVHFENILGWLRMADLKFIDKMVRAGNSALSFHNYTEKIRISSR